MFAPNTVQALVGGVVVAHKETSDSHEAYDAAKDLSVLHPMAEIIIVWESGESTRALNEASGGLRGDN